LSNLLSGRSVYGLARFTCSQGARRVMFFYNCRWYLRFVHTIVVLKKLIQQLLPQEPYTRIQVLPAPKPYKCIQPLPPRAIQVHTATPAQSHAPAQTEAWTCAWCRAGAPA